MIFLLLKINTLITIAKLKTYFYKNEERIINIIKLKRVQDSNL